MDEHGVGAGGRVGPCPAESLFHAEARDQRLGAGDHGEGGVAPSRSGSFDLPRVLVDCHEIAANPCVKAAPLREVVVLDADAGRARALELADRPHDVDRVAVAVVAVGDDGDADGVDDAADRLERLGEGQDVRVRHGLNGRDPEAARPDGVEAGSLGELGRQRVMRARREDDGPSREQRQERFPRHCADSTKGPVVAL